MYTFSPDYGREKKLSNIFYILYLSMLRYCFNYQLLIKKLPQVTTTLRWLLRRGSPLPIPNRVVKPASADGTAVMWESMSSPFF